MTNAEIHFTKEYPDRIREVRLTGIIRIEFVEGASRWTHYGKDGPTTKRYQNTWIDYVRLAQG